MFYVISRTPLEGAFPITREGYIEMALAHFFTAVAARLLKEHSECVPVLERSAEEAIVCRKPGLRGPANRVRARYRNGRERAQIRIVAEPNALGEQKRLRSIERRCESRLAV